MMVNNFGLSLSSFNASVAGRAVGRVDVCKSERGEVLLQAACYRLCRGPKHYTKAHRGKLGYRSKSAVVLNQFVAVFVIQ